ncbi:HNH endonuclease [Pseudomonas sp. 31-12]|uniref:HNH endonuclease n=1 Tax=Pseudomonas sp. 31-12 TaxID=2201356 RepID=UPI000D6D0873|nr:HNH endonuclease [Pseudomonas sp. 31-12]AWM93788.1 HNH endonuclease [Pseudomonas sp. 31-12]
MTLDPRSLAERVSAEIGLELTGTEGQDGDGCRWFELLPAGHPAGQTFTIRTIVGWRRVDVHFRPGNFAGDLIHAMSSVDDACRRTFGAILATCREAGAEVLLTVNGTTCDYEDHTIWEYQWRSLGLLISKGMLAINGGDAETDMREIELWTSRLAAAIVALLPLEAEEIADESLEVVGLPEGAKTRIEVNRYERDRRNRAAAIAIHGYACKVCYLEMSERYGPAAAGLIEVHHVTPVSKVGPGYIVDPRTDLIPLCPNCHSAAHRRSPPFTVVELQEILQQRKKDGRAAQA